MDEASFATESIDSMPPPPASSSSAVDREAPSDTIEEDESLLTKGKQGRSNNEYIMIRKSTLIVFGFLLFAFMGLFGYFFTEWYMARVDNSSSDIRGVGDIPTGATDAPAASGPSANETGCFQEEIVPDCEFTLDDVLALQQEIDRLEAANDQLADQLDDYAEITDRLNATIEEFKIQNEILAANNDEYEALNAQLNASLAELQEQNAFLAEQVDIYAGLNQDLNATALNLEEQVNRLEVEVDRLTAQTDRLEALVGSLSEETEHLTELGDMLQDNVDRLEDRVEDLVAENDRLEALVADLQTVADFLDETAQNLNESFDEVAAFLAEQISTNRFLVVESLQNTYHQRVANWDCALRDRFALEDFSRGDGNLAIPDDILPTVILYVEERVLSDLCLDTTDFEVYMSNRYNGDDITLNRLTTSVQRYTWDALDHYFPEANEDGLTPEDWAVAAYECGNLSADQQYRFSAN